MLSRSFPVVAVAFALALTSASSAQEANPEASRLRAKAVTDSLKAYDASLAGTIHFGIYLHGQRVLGQGTITVASAGGDALHAVYKATLGFDITFGESRSGQRESLLLGAHLGALSLSQTNTLTAGSSVEQHSTRVELGEEQWICNKTDNGIKLTTVFPVGGLNHQGLASRLLLTRKLDLKTPGTYRFSEIDWPPVPGDGEEPGAASTQDVVYTIPPATEYSHRGKTLRAHLLTIKRESLPTATVAVDLKGKLLAFWAEGTPLRMIVGTKTEASANISEAKAIVPGTKTPLAVCALYVHVAAHLKDVDALDPVVDWKSAHKAMATRNRMWRQFGVEAFQSRIKMSLKEAAGLTKSEVEQFLMILEEKIEGDEATVSAATLARPFKLKKFGADWKMIQLPE